MSYHVTMTEPESMSSHVEAERAPGLSEMERLTTKYTVSKGMGDNVVSLIINNKSK